VSRPERHVFPLVPRWRVSGLPFGEHRSVRRGPGSDVAGSRAYHPGDPVSAIDWYASARLSAAQGDAAFVVRERFAEEAPRVVIVFDRRPSMGLYAPPFPWLSKPAACTEIVDAIVVSALAARSEIGYVDHARSADGAADPHWLPPRSRGRRWEIAQRVTSDGFDAPEDALEAAIAYLARMRADLPSGTFVFVLSDFLAAPSLEAWRRALSLQWDVVPVVVQDPRWEQSFPDAHSVIVPFADPASGEVVSVRLRAGEASERRRMHEERLQTLLRDFRTLGLDPVVIGTSDRGEIDSTLLAWAELRRQSRRRGR
jgi:uncharacterized protein (DUF58 family)